MAFQKYLKDKSELISNVYLVSSKDDDERKIAVEAILKAIEPLDSKRAFAISAFDANHLDIDTLSMAIDAPPLFSDKSIIWLQQSEKLTKPIQEKLQSVLSNPPKQLYLIFSTTNLSKNSGFFKIIQQNGIILDLVELKPWEKEKLYADQIYKQAELNGKKITLSTCQLFVKLVGLDQVALQQEFEKLICFCLTEKEITSTAVKQICHKQNTDSAWQLGEALFFRNTKTALQIVSELLLDKQAFLPLLRQVRFQFQSAYQLSILLKNNTNISDITAEFPYMKGKILEKNIQQTQAYGGCAVFKDALLRIDMIENDAKNSKASDQVLAELLVLYLTQHTQNF